MSMRDCVAAAPDGPGSIAEMGMGVSNTQMTNLDHKLANLGRLDSLEVAVLIVFWDCL